MTDPAAFWVSGLAVGSLVGAGLGFVVGVAIGSMKRHRPGHHRRGSNPMAPGCKPEPPIGPPQRPGPYSSSARGLPPPPPPPGTRREYLYSPATMAECGGPCFDAWHPQACDCGALWRDVPRWDEGRTQRGNGSGGPTTPKPNIIPRPQGGTFNPPLTDL